jgi:hypothetical protein
LQWVPEIKEYAEGEPRLILVGTKVDLRDKSKADGGNVVLRDEVTTA